MRKLISFLGRLWAFARPAGPEVEDLGLRNDELIVVLGPGLTMMEIADAAGKKHKFYSVWHRSGPMFLPLRGRSEKWWLARSAN